MSVWAWVALIVGVAGLLLWLTATALVTLASRLGEAMLQAWKDGKL